MKVITFYSDKGGVGATMFTVCLASYLAYVENKRICIIDRANGFRTLTEARLQEVENIKNNLDNYRVRQIIPDTEYAALQNDPLTGSSVHICQIKTFSDLQQFFRRNKSKYDFVLIDLSGVEYVNLQYIMKSHHIMLITTFEEQYKDFKTYAAFEHILSKERAADPEKVRTPPLDFNNDTLMMVMNRVKYSHPNFNEEDIVSHPIHDPAHPMHMTFFKRSLYERETKDYSTITGLLESSDEMKEFCQELFREHLN